MKINFKHNGNRVSIVNRFIGNMEINSFNMKYDIRMFDTALNGWTRVGSCNTIASGYNFVENNF